MIYININFTPQGEKMNEFGFEKDETDYKIEEMEEQLAQIRMANKRKKEEFEKALRQQMRLYYTDFLRNNVSLLEKESGIKGIGEWARKTYKQNLERIYLITINPQEGTDLDLFVKKIKKCCNKKWVDNWMYCIEWRDCWKGMHCHIRLQLNKGKKPSEVRRETYNTFKNMVGNPQHVNVKYGVRNDAFIEYIKGIKDGKDKHNSEFDRANRVVLGLDNWYSNSVCA